MNPFNIPPAHILNAAVVEWAAAYEATVVEWAAEPVQLNLRAAATHIGNLNIGHANTQIEPLTHGEFEYNIDYVRVNGDNHLIYDIDALEAHYNSGNPSASFNPRTDSSV
jgi:hypothetical protein